MLTMDLQHLSHTQVVDAVYQHCGQFGEVKSIDILQPPERPGLAFALVSMTAPQNLDLIVDKLGDGKVASLAIIKIEQEKPYIPASILSRLRPEIAAQV